MELDLELHQRSAEVHEEAPPPSYYASLRSNVKDTNITSYSALARMFQQDRPPTTNWFVCSSSDPSTWQLLASGPLMSNVTTSANNSPTKKRRYRILYPLRKYEDVYLHRPPWVAQASAFPLLHTEVYSGRSRYNSEPIVILGPPEYSESSPTESDVRALASFHNPRVIFAVENQVRNMTRQATFAEMEFLSWDWTMKTVGANHDMQTMILRAKEECAKSVELVGRLEKFLAYVGRNASMDVLENLKRICKEVQWKLERFTL